MPQNDTVAEQKISNWNWSMRPVKETMSRKHHFSDTYRGLNLDINLVVIQKYRKSKSKLVH